MTIPATSIFGSSVTLNETVPTDKVLEIHLNNFEDVANGGDITGGVGLDDASAITAANLDANASRILSSIVILHQQQQPADNTDETNGTYIDFDPNFDKAFVTRNATGQIRYRYKVDTYTNDSVTALDPDDVVGS